MADKPKPKDFLTPEELAAVTPFVKARIPVNEGPGCFMCKWIHEDLTANGKLTGYPKEHTGAESFPAASKILHLKIEGALK